MADLKCPPARPPTHELRSTNMHAAPKVALNRTCHGSPGIDCQHLPLQSKHSGRDMRVNKILVSTKKLPPNAAICCLSPVSDLPALQNHIGTVVVRTRSALGPTPIGHTISSQFIVHLAHPSVPPTGPSGAGSGQLGGSPILLIIPI